jgi:hypothetical protein
MADESVGRRTVTRSQARRRRGGSGLFEKFNILLALAKRLMKLHRAALERSFKKPNKSRH